MLSFIEVVFAIFETKRFTLRYYRVDRKRPKGPPRDPSRASAQVARRESLLRSGPIRDGLPAAGL